MPKSKVFEKAKSPVTATGRAGVFRIRDAVVSAGFVRLNVEGAPQAKLLSSTRDEDRRARNQLVRLTKQIPPERLQQAIDALSILVTPSKPAVVTATDDEFTAATAEFIKEYEPALRRLAKR